MGRPPAKVFTAQEVAGLLREAKAVEPWDNEDLLGRLAQIMTRMRHFVMLGKDRPKWQPPDVAGWEAAIKIRKLLPALRAQYTIDFRSEHSPPDDIALAMEAERTLKLKQLSAIENSLHAYFPSRPQRGAILEGTWHENAAVLFQWYCYIVGHGHHGNGGPAVEFVRQALEAVGRAKPEAMAVEKALDRFEQAYMTKIHLAEGDL